MKRVQFIFALLCLFSFSLSSFKAVDSTSYGGTGSVRINIYKKDLSNNQPIGDKLRSVRLNVTVSCYSSSVVEAKEKIEREIRSEAGRKVDFLETWEYDDEIDYRISTCE